MNKPALALLVVGLIYSLAASFFAYRESGKLWMLFQPHWIDANSGVSSKIRLHGKIAFAILFIGTGLFFFLD